MCFVLAGGLCGLITSTLTAWLAGSDYYIMLLYFDESGPKSQPALRGGLTGMSVGLAEGCWYLLLSVIRKPPRVPLSRATLARTIQLAALTLFLCWFAGMLLTTVWIQTTPEVIMDAYFPGGLADGQWVRAVSCTLGGLVGQSLGIIGSGLVITLAALRRSTYSSLSDRG